MRRAFKIAQGRGKKVTSIDKQNVLATSKLWRKIADEVSLEFPDVTLEHQLVDSAAMIMITNPARFDVVVTENLFGDILSDESSVLPGTLGVMPSASHSENGPIFMNYPWFSTRHCRSRYCQPNFNDFISSYDVA